MPERFTGGALDIFRLGANNKRKKFVRNYCLLMKKSMRFLNKYISSNRKWTGVNYKISNRLLDMKTVISNSQ